MNYKWDESLSYINFWEIHDRILLLSVLAPTPPATSNSKPTPPFSLLPEENVVSLHLIQQGRLRKSDELELKIWWWLCTVHFETSSAAASKVWVTANDLRWLARCEAKRSMSWASTGVKKYHKKMKSQENKTKQTENLKEVDLIRKQTHKQKTTKNSLWYKSMHLPGNRQQFDITDSLSSLSLLSVHVQRV